MPLTLCPCDNWVTRRPVSARPCLGHCHCAGFLLIDSLSVYGRVAGWLLAPCRPYTNIIPYLLGNHTLPCTVGQHLWEPPWNRPLPPQR